MEGFYNHAKQYDHKTQSLDENLSIDFRNYVKLYDYKTHHW